MKSTHWTSVARSWMGIAAACIAVVAAGWLLSAYIHARLVAPAEKAYVDELKQTGRTDIEIQRSCSPNWTASTNRRSAGVASMIAAACSCWS